jgi:hypothetical protein
VRWHEFGFISISFMALQTDVHDSQQERTQQEMNNANISPKMIIKGKAAHSTHTFKASKVNSTGMHLLPVITEENVTYVFSVAIVGDEILQTGPIKWTR